MLAAGQGYEVIRDWLSEQCGMAFPEKKRELLTYRLNSVVSRFGLADIDALAEQLTRGQGTELQLAVMHAASTNHTFFFRELQVLEYFRDNILTSRSGTGPMRIWSAAASSGDEAYSLAIMATEMFGVSAASRVSILGTDISQPAIGQAESAIYSTSHLEHTPPQVLQRYFQPVGLGQYRVVPEVRRLCTFRRLNLKTSPYPFSNRFHAVFCRNVLYYFDRQHQFQILEQLYDATEPGGWLLTSVTEVVRDLRTRWEHAAGGVWRKPL